MPLPLWPRARSIGLLLLLATPLAAQQSKPRARDLGIPFDGTPGPLNAITDVSGIEVGQVTIIQGAGKAARGKGPVRTGVTAILPRGKKDSDPVYAGMVDPERQRRNDRDHLAGGIGVPLGTGDDHQHAQRRASCATPLSNGPSSGTTTSSSGRSRS